jgi:hypothetical protein
MARLADDDRLLDLSRKLPIVLPKKPIAPVRSGVLLCGNRGTMLKP